MCDLLRVRQSVQKQHATQQNDQPLSSANFFRTRETGGKTRRTHVAITASATHIMSYNVTCDEQPGDVGLNVLTTGNPFWGTKLLGVSTIGRDFWGSRGVKAAGDLEPSPIPGFPAHSDL